LVGTWFNIYIFILSALAHKDLESLELLNILRIMSNNVQFLFFFATPFDLMNQAWCIGQQSHILKETLQMVYLS
jgi:hypothetical protein